MVLQFFNNTTATKPSPFFKLKIEIMEYLYLLSFFCGLLLGIWLGCGRQEKYYCNCYPTFPKTVDDRCSECGKPIKELKPFNPDDYFGEASVYPAFLVHFAQGNLHPWILTYYCRHINNIIEQLPSDIVEFNVRKDKHEILEQMELWWFQLLNSNVFYLVKEFFNALHNRG